MAHNQLILHPAAIDAAPSPDALLETLRRLGFISEAFSWEGETHYRAGDEFLMHITFLGCSPVIDIDGPGANGEFCHIAIDPPAASAKFLAGENVKPPRCPACGHRETEWRQVVESWQADPSVYRYTCLECGSQNPLPELRWRQSAGMARIFIRIYGVFEGEAVPGEQLMSALERHGGRWRYFYLRG